MYPDAQLIGMEGLPEKKKEQGLTFDFVFDKKNNEKTFGPQGEVYAPYLDCIDVRLNRDISLDIQTKKSHSCTNLPKRLLRQIWY